MKINEVPPGLEGYLMRVKAGSTIKDYVVDGEGPLSIR